MKRTGSSIDDLMQLALYMIPKYMKRIDRYNRRHYKNLGHDKEYYEERYMDNKELLEFIEKNILKQEGILTGKKDKDKEKPQKSENQKIENPLDDYVAKNVKNVLEGKKPESGGSKASDKKLQVDNKIDNKKENNDNKISKDKEEKQNNDNVPNVPKVDEEDNKDEKVEKKDYLEKKNREQISKKISKPNGIVKKKYRMLSVSNRCSNCNKGISSIMDKLTGEKLDVCVKDDKMSIFNEVNLIHSDKVLIKFVNELGEKIITPIKNIVALQSDKLSSLDKYLDEIPKGYRCILERNMEDYFKSIIGKRVTIQTVGQGKFAYMYNKVITKVGLGFIIVEDNILVAFSSIVLIKELKDIHTEKNE